VAGLAVALRLLAVGLAGIVALATIDQTELADALVEHLRAPARFAVGTLAAMRLLPLFAREWEVRGLARRARGIDDGRGPLALISFPARTFGLLVGAIRRATSLALAMDARGFGSRPCRTVARPRPFRRRDVILVAGATLVAVAVAAVARV
jgi:energy-coupling factor transport system permease protein